MYVRFNALVYRVGLPYRVSAALYDAARGLVVTRGRYVRVADVKPGTARRRPAPSRRGRSLLTAKGETKGRTYEATETLITLRREVRAELPQVPDPCLQQYRPAIPGQEDLFPERPGWLSGIPGGIRRPDEGPA